MELQVLVLWRQHPAEFKTQLPLVFLHQLALNLQLLSDDKPNVADLLIGSTAAKFAVPVFYGFMIIFTYQSQW